MRNSSRPERSLAATSVLVVVGLTAWSLFPATPSDQTSALETQAGGQQSAAPATGTTNQAATGGGGTGPAAGALPGAAAAPGAVTAGAAGPGAQPGGTGPSPIAGAQAPGATSSSCPAAGEIGVSNTQINVAAVLINLAGAIGNGAVG